MSEWIYFIHPPRDHFAETMTDEEREVWRVHFERLKRLVDDGVMILAGPTLGPVNTGIAIFEAPDEDAARKILNDDPVIAGGYARGELRPSSSRFYEVATESSTLERRAVKAVQNAKPRIAVPNAMSRNTKVFWNSERSPTEIPT